MKNKLNIANYVLTVCLFCALYVFVFDLVCIDRISKFDHIWLNVCLFEVGNEYSNCMINYDIIAILTVLLILLVTSYYLFRHYHKYALLIPFFGFVLFILSVITCWGLI